jgi:hypothetical protein
LKSEARAIAKFADHPFLQRLAAASASDRAASELAESLGMQIGSRLRASMKAES